MATLQQALQQAFDPELPRWQQLRQLKLQTIRARLISNAGWFSRGGVQYTVKPALTGTAALDAAASPAHGAYSGS